MVLSKARRTIYAALALGVALASAYATESEVTVYNPQARIELAGTLALPDAGDAEALFVLASGSGAQNRDEEVMGHRPFKVLSDTLVAHGYGVLRVDDRGVGSSQGDFESAVLDDFTSDAIAAVGYLRELFPDKKIGILGHSQGGQVAVKAAARGVTDFIVTLAGPAWPGDSLIMSQCRALAVATTGSWPGEALERRLLDLAMTDVPSYVLTTLLVQEFEPVYGEAFKMPQVQNQLYASVQPLALPMYRDLLRYNPADDIRAVNVPWLALNGDRDLQVLVANLDTFRELNPDVRTVVVEGHNHLFQPAVTGLPDEYPTAGRSPSDATLAVLLEAIPGMIR